MASKNDSRKNMNKYERRRRMAAVICAVVVAALVLSMICSSFIFVNVASAATAAELQKQVTQAQKNRDSAKKQLESVQTSVANVSKEIQSLDQEISRAETELAETESAIEESKILLQQKEAELAVAEENCIEYDDTFKTRARIMYENGTGSYLEVLFGATSFGDFLSRVEMIKEIVEYDKKMLAELIASRNAINEARQAVADEKEALELRQTQLELMSEELADRLQAKTLLYAQLEQDEAQYAKVYADAEAEKKKLEAQLKAQAAKEAAEAAKNGTGGYTGNGQFLWPCPSSTRITSNYGYRIHPIYGTRKLHAGVDIGASYGAAIVAAEAGTVITAQYSSSYGNYVVISHGGGISTLYAHASSLTVKVGDKVSRGQTIAKVGATGAATGNHLHFEVRINGSTTEPLSYIK